MIDIVLYIITILALIIASYTDFKKREVPDWLSYGLISAALGIRLLYSIFNLDFSIFLSGLFGFSLLFVVAYAAYYLGQWGGGDSKILMAIGAILGFTLNLVLFAGLLIFAGAFYGVFYSIYLAIKNKKSFVKSFKEQLKEFKYLIVFALIFLSLGILGLILISDFGLGFLAFGASAIFFVGIGMFVFVRSVELSCLYKKVKSHQLTEGDWVVEDIKINNKLVVSKKSIGISKHHIKKLRNYRKLILIKLGIPFIPAFLIAFIALLLLKDWVFSLI